MVHHQHLHGSVHRKQNSGELNHLVIPQYSYRKPTLLRLFLLFSLFSFVATALFLSSPYFSLLDDEEKLQAHGSQELPCSSITNNSICCDRSARRSDVCFMKGHVSTHSQSNTFFLFSNATTKSHIEHIIRPYTRKWEEQTMSTIDELRLVTSSNRTGRCDVKHDVPAVVFSTGGYTGNVYHEFNDGIVPLYITSHQFDKKVVFVILEYHDWWISKYQNILSQLSDYPPVDFANDKRAHCFDGAIVGLKIHDELTVDAAKMRHNKTVLDFRNMLDEAYRPRIQDIIQEENKRMEAQVRTDKPKLVIVSRNGSRGIENEGELVKLGGEIGFDVEVLRPKRTTELAKIYRSLNSSDVMIGVHGAAMTHLLFMRPGSVFIQVVPLGTDWAAESYYGEPARKLGLKYVGYKILPRESSLYREYKKDDLVLRDPESVNAKGWEVTKKVYLDGQNVRLDLERFRRRLARAHQYLVGKGRKTL